MAEDIKRKTTVGIIWRGLERTASKGLQFVFSVLIARVLMPEDYGLIAIANLCISLSEILVDSGFSKAIIRKQDRTPEDFNTAFLFNISMATVLYAAIWVLAPFLADYYHQPALTKVVRYTTIAVIINALIGIPSAKESIAMNFKRIAIIETVAMCTAGAIGVLSAYAGLGVFALVLQLVSGSFIRLFLYYLSVRWLPSLSFSLASLKELFSFGVKLLFTDFIHRIFNAFVTMTIGKQFSAKQLGFYGKADAFASTPNSVLSTPLWVVTYPAISKIQNEKEALQRNFVPMISLSSYIIFPCLIGLIAIANPLVPLVLTEKWSAIIPMMRILLVNYLFQAMIAIPQNYLLALGKTTLILRLNVLTRLVGVLLLFPCCKLSLNAVCWMLTAISLLALVLDIVYVWRIVHFSIGAFFRDLFQILIACLVMALTVRLILDHVASPVWAVLCACLTGVFIYWGISALTKNRQYEALKTILLQLVKDHLPSR